VASSTRLLDASLCSTRLHFGEDRVLK
jgi:hypothetical protein